VPSGREPDPGGAGAAGHPCRIDHLAGRGHRRRPSPAGALRALPVGFPLGRPSDATSQQRVVRELLRVVLADGVPLVMEMRRDGWERVDGPAVINRMDGRSRLRGTRSWARPRCNVPWSGETICMVKPCALPLPRNRSP
jgi:hypothetical protein